MYLIRLASGEERTFATIEDLAVAVQRGEVSREAAIFHRRSNRWLPLEHHPYFAYATGEQPAVPSAPDEEPAPEAPQEPAPPPEPKPPEPATPDVDPPRSLIDEEERRSNVPSNVAPLRPEPIAPTPLKMPPAPVVRPERDRYTEPFRRAETEPVFERPAPRSGPEPLAVAPPRGRRIGTLIAIIIVLGAAVGIFIGLRLRQGATASRREPVAEAPGYRPAPPPSSLLRDSASPSGDTLPSPAPAPAQRVDPTAPATPDQLMERRRQAFLAAQARLGRDLAAVDFNAIFGVRALSTPEGARAARRTVASALNVMGQFHRQEVMTDRAYDDTAAYQTTRAGWTREQIDRWSNRPTLKEPYQSADLAESLLADADSLLAILGNGVQWTVAGDTLIFPDSSRAHAFSAQRARIETRAGGPVPDTVQRPTLAYVRGAVDPTALPVAGP